MVRNSAFSTRNDIIFSLRDRFVVAVFLTTMVAANAMAQESGISCADQLADRAIVAKTEADLSDIDRTIARNGCLSGILEQLEASQLQTQSLEDQLQRCQDAETVCPGSNGTSEISKEQLAQVLRSELEGLGDFSEYLRRIEAALAQNSHDKVPPFGTTAFDLLQFVLDRHIQDLDFEVGCGEPVLQPVGAIPDDEGFVTLVASGAVSKESDRIALLDLSLPIAFQVRDELQIDPSIVSCSSPTEQITTDSGFLIAVNDNGAVVTVLENEARSLIGRLPPVEDCTPIAAIIDGLPELETYRLTVPRSRQGAWTHQKTSSGNLVIAACAVTGGEIQRVFNPEPLASYLVLELQQ